MQQCFHGFTNLPKTFKCYQRSIWSAANKCLIKEAKTLWIPQEPVKAWSWHLTWKLRNTCLDLHVDRELLWVVNDPSVLSIITHFDFQLSVTCPSRSYFFTFVTGIAAWPCWRATDEGFSFCCVSWKSDTGRHKTHKGFTTRPLLIHNMGKVQKHIKITTDLRLT